MGPITKQYEPTHRFFASAMSQTGITDANALAALALPARNIGSLSIKLKRFRDPVSPCSRGSLLSEPLVALVCRNSASLSPTLLTLPAKPAPSLDRSAQGTARQLLATAVMQDPLLELARMAELYAPLNDFADVVNNRLFTDVNAFLAQPNPTPKGVRLLNGSLQVLTIGVSQLAMLYGDITASLIFDQLWDSNVNRFHSETDNLNKSQKDALALLRSGNTYLIRNVLMLGLDRTSKVSGTGQGIAYQFAIDWMLRSSVDPPSQLKNIFGAGWKFENAWRPLDVDPDNPKVSLDRCAHAVTPNKDVCYKQPIVRFLGVEAPLPTIDEFAGREFTYPPVLREMLGLRDQIAARVADYRMFEWTGASPEERVELVKSLLRSF